MKTLFSSLFPIIFLFVCIHSNCGVKVVLHGDITMEDTENDVNPEIFYEDIETQDEKKFNFQNWILKIGSEYGDGCSTLLTNNEIEFTAICVTYSSNKKLWILQMDYYGNILSQKAITPLTYFEIGSAERFSNGGIIIAGKIEEEYSNKDKTWVIKINSLGEILWQKTFELSNFSTGATYMTITSDEEIIIATLYPIITGENDGYFVPAIIKLDYEGNIIWYKAFNFNLGSEITTLTTNSSGDIYIAVCKFDSRFSGPWLLKLDENGNILWQKVFDFPSSLNWVPYFSDILLTSDGSIILVGTTNGEFEESGDMWILKLNDSGNIIWQKTIGEERGRKSWGAASVIEAKNGEILVGGSGVFYSQYIYTYDMILLKLDNDGNLLWNKVISYNEQDYLENIIESPDGDIIFEGSSGLVGNYFGDISSYDILIGKINGNGEFNGTCDLIKDMSLIFQDGEAIAFESNIEFFNATIPTVNEIEFPIYEADTIGEFLCTGETQP